MEAAATIASGSSTWCSIKNNHLEAAGGVRAAMDRVKAARPHYVKVEVEVESEADLREAIACGADVIMLDNQDVESLREAGADGPGARARSGARGLRAGCRSPTSGQVAETGVDLISTSALTMGAPPVDLGLTLTVGG